MVDPQRPEFLTAVEAAAVDSALLTNHEKFLVRLTISSQRLLLHIARQRQQEIADLTCDQIIEWFEQDAKIRHEQGTEKAFLQW